MTCFQVSTLVENNERIYDTRHGGFVQFKDRQGINCIEYFFSLWEKPQINVYCMCFLQVSLTLILHIVLNV